MNNQFIRNSLLSGASVMAAISMSGNVTIAVADDAAEEGFMLEEITVTARRRDESLQNVPIAVTAFSGAELLSRGISDITELAQSAPSVTLEASRATNSTLTAFIRGVGQQDPLAGFEQGVGIYLDDVYLARPQGSLLEVYEVERIEILRGPQGTLYGRNTVGGAVKYVTKRLSDEASLSARGSFGSYKQIDGVISASLPISDTLRIGGAVASLNRDGFGDNSFTGEDNYNKEILAFRGSIEFEPNEDVFIRISGDYSDDDSNPRFGHRTRPGVTNGEPVLDNVFDTRAGAAVNASTASIGGNNEIKAKGVQGLLEWSFNENLTFKSTTAYREDRSETVIDFDSLPVGDFDAAVIYENDQFSQEFQLAYTSEKLKGMVGFYYLDASALNDFDVILGGVTAFTGGVVETKAWSIFGEITYDATEDISLTLGGRYTNDKRTADVLRQVFLGIGSPFFGNDGAVFLLSQSDFENSRTDKKFTPRIILDYKFNDDVTAYASFSKGFKGGSFDPRGASVNGSNPDVEAGYDPENITNYEAGIKSTFADGRARLNIAVFHSDYTDMQVPGSLPIDTDMDGVNDGFVGSVTNAGKATIQGIEVEGTFLVTEDFIIQSNISVLNANIVEWILNGVNVANQRVVQNTPEFMSFLGATYTVPLSNGELSLSGRWSYKGAVSQFETSAPEIDQGPYSLFDASIVWTSDDNTWNIGLHGKNLADERYITAGYDFGLGRPVALGAEDNETAFFGAPRTVTFTVGYKY